MYIYTYRYVYIYMHMYVHLCIYTHIYMYVYVYDTKPVLIYIHMYMYTCIYQKKNVHIYIHIYVHLCTFMYVYTYLYVCVYVYDTKPVLIYIHTDMYITWLISGSMAGVSKRVSHDIFIRMTRRIPMLDMTHSYVTRGAIYIDTTDIYVMYPHNGHDSWICDTRVRYIDTIASSVKRISHDDVMRMTWCNHMLDMTHSNVTLYQVLLARQSAVQNGPYICVCHDSYMCVPWLIQARQSAVQNGQHTATYCNTLQRTTTHYNTLQHTATVGSAKRASRDGFTCVTWRIHKLDSSRWVLQHCTGFARLVWGRLRVHRAFVYSDSFVCDVAHPYVSGDSFIFDT